MRSFSKGCEQAAISGMVLAQPYLDYNRGDPAQGDGYVKIWEYNSFLVDPYFRNHDMSDCRVVWCQEYVSREEAVERFGDKAKTMGSVSGSSQQYGNFYFLPENHDMARNNLLVVSYIWYKSKTKKKKLYSKKRQQFFDFAGDDFQSQLMMQAIPDLKLVEIEVPTWKVCLVLNDQLMYNGVNPLGFDDCPFVPIMWNYDPHISYSDLRVRSLLDRS
jgi:hypothetical protein